MTLVPVTGYLPGQAVQINSQTGMIGTPVATDGGIVVRCYINSNIKIGQLIQINQAEINQSAVTNHNLSSHGGRRPLLPGRHYAGWLLPSPCDRLCRRHSRERLVL